MPSYQPTGPFVNGAAPPIAAPFLNNIEGWIQQVEGTNPLSATGTIAGTVYVHEILQGTVKAILVHFSSYQSAAQTLVLPVSFTAGAMVWTTETQSGTIEFLQGAVAQTLSVMTGSYNVAGGAQQASNLIKHWSYGMVRSGFNALRFTFTSGTNASGFALVVGK